MAFDSALYWSLLVPALTSLMSTFGYFFSKSAATCFSVGSHAHTVTVPPFFRADLMSAEPTFLSLDPSSEPPQAVAPRARAQRRPMPRRTRRECLGMGMLPLLRGRAEGGV